MSMSQQLRSSATHQTEIENFMRAFFERGEKKEQDIKALGARVLHSS